MHRFKKSQITLFIIIGLVLLAVFGFLFYASSIVANAKIEQGLKKIADQMIETSAIKYYVTICLDKAVQNAIVTVGKQGGVVYKNQLRTDFQKGSYPENPETGTLTSVKYPGTEEGVYLGISPLSFTACPTFSNPAPPYYPKQECLHDYLDLSPDETISANPTYSLGDPALKALCSDTGPNRIEFGGAYAVPCLSHISEGSVQEFLSQYVSSIVEECVSPESFGAEIELKTPWTEAVIGEKDITFRFFYPISVSVKGKEFVKLLEFTRKTPVRLKYIHELAWSIIEDDRSYLFTDISEYTSGDRPLTDINTRASGMSLQRVPATNPIPSYIYTITDSFSAVGTESTYNFRFAIPNRNPALDWIHLTAREINEYDIAVVRGAKITLDPKAYDPDDDYAFGDTGLVGEQKLVYEITGWKETWDDFFDASCCSNFNPFGVDCSTAAFMQCQTTGDPDGDDGASQNPSLSPVAKWTDSTEWINTLRNAIYTTKKENPTTLEEDYSDLGYHDVKIRVYEPEHGQNYKDWQDIRILVVDKPKAVLVKRSLYEDILTDEAASVEDPFFISGINSIFLTGPLIYKFEDITGKDMPDSEAIHDWDSAVAIPDFWESPITGEGCQDGFCPTDEFTIPVSQNIDTIQLDYFKKSNLIGPADGIYIKKLQHRMKLSAMPETTLVSGGEQVASVTQDFTVYECLPHKDAYDDPNFAPDTSIELSAPYPYSEWTGDDSYTGDTYDPSASVDYFRNTDTSSDAASAYRATHVCCDGEPSENPPTNPSWGNYKDAGAVCYNLDYYTCSPLDRYTTPLPPADLAVTDSNGILQPSPITPSFSANPNLENNQNDIYERTYTQKCSGNRGNACSGGITDTWTVAVVCPDKGAGETRRCQGPAPASQTTCPFDSSNNIYEIDVPPSTPACYTYTYTTFEKSFLGEGGRSHICNEEWKCKPKNSNEYNTGLSGAFACQATCYSGDCKRTAYFGVSSSDTCKCSDNIDEPTDNIGGAAFTINCGASCDGSDDVDNTDLTGDTCKNNCALISCAWTETDCDTYDLTSLSLMKESELTASSCTSSCLGSNCCNIQSAPCNEANQCKRFYSLITNEDETPDYICYKPNSGDWRWAANAESQETACDNFDNDCDGTPDTLGTTTCGTGACQRTVQNCINGVPQICTPPAENTEELCLDLIDNDCDGWSDCEDGDCIPIVGFCGM